MLRNLEWIQELNICYDASTFDTDPFEPERYGVETIYPLYVEGTNGREGYAELPYTLPQDSTLFLLLALTEDDGCLGDAPAKLSLGRGQCLEN
jgi:hypothetical protein